MKEDFLLTNSGDWGRIVPNKLLKGPSDKAGGSFNVACQDYTEFGIILIIPKKILYRI